MHVSNTLPISAEGPDALKTLPIGTSGRRCPSFLHICYQDSHRHSLNRKYVRNFFLHHTEERTQPGSYHIQKAFGKVGATESCSRAKGNGQLFLVLFPSLANCSFSRCRDRCKRLGIGPHDYWAGLLHMCWGLKARKLKRDLLVTKLVWGPMWQMQGRSCMKTAAVGTDNSTTAVVYSLLLWLLTVIFTIGIENTLEIGFLIKIDQARALYFNITSSPQVFIIWALWSNLLPCWSLKVVYFGPTFL